jgi:hypothetical protein
MLDMAIIESEKYGIEDLISFEELEERIGVLEVIRFGKTLKLNSYIGKRLVEGIKRIEQDMLWDCWKYDISLSQRGLVTRITYTVTGDY